MTLRKLAVTVASAAVIAATTLTAAQATNDPHPCGAPACTAWTVYTPDRTANLANWRGFFAYKVIGHTMFLRAFFNAGVNPQAGFMEWSLPPGYVAPTQEYFVGTAPGAISSADFLAAGPMILARVHIAARTELGGLGFMTVLEVEPQR